MSARQKNDQPKPWRPGDPVGAGRVYLPDEETQAAYGAACRAAVVDALARWVIAGDLREVRRKRLESCPRNVRDDVEQRARELWASGAVADRPKMRDNSRVG